MSVLSDSPARSFLDLVHVKSVRMYPNTIDIDLAVVYESLADVYKDIEKERSTWKNGLNPANTIFKAVYKGIHARIDNVMISDLQWDGKCCTFTIYSQIDSDIIFELKFSFLN